MKLFVWTLLALVFGVAGMQSVGAMCVALVFMGLGVYEIWKRGNSKDKKNREDMW